jgi:hypothetical protein
VNQAHSGEVIDNRRYINARHFADVGKNPAVVVRPILRSDERDTGVGRPRKIITEENGKSSMRMHKVGRTELVGKAAENPANELKPESGIEFELNAVNVVRVDFSSEVALRFEGNRRSGADLPGLLMEDHAGITLNRGLGKV